jgi:hypothetical protein
MTSQSERGVYATSSFESPQASRFAHVRRMPKRREGRYVFSVAQTSESAVSQVSKPAGHSIQKDASAARDGQPTQGSALRRE